MENKGCSRFKIENYKNFRENVVNTSPSNPNEAIRFDNKTDDDIIYRSGFTTLRPIEYLLLNAANSKQALRRLKNGKIPRPQNSWIIYRKDKSAHPRFKGLQPGVIANEISIMWREESQEVKGFYAALAREADRLHKLRYENYRYQPGPYNRRSNKNKTSKQSKEPNTQATPTPSPAAQQLLTPVTTSSSPVLEEQLPQNFPLLSEIELLSPELQQQYLPPEFQQQYLLTPVSSTYSPASSEESELNFAEFVTFPLPNTPNTELEELGQQFLEETTSPFEQYNNAPINLLEFLQQNTDFSLSPTGPIEVPDASQYGDFELYDTQQFNISQTNQMNFFAECDNTQMDFDNNVFDNGMAVQQQYNNSQNFYNTNMIDEQVLENLWNSFNEQQRQLVSNIFTPGSNLFKKSE